MATVKTQKVPNWVRAIHSLNTYLSEDLFGGPKLYKMAWAINLHKGLSVFVITLMMIWFKNYSIGVSKPVGEGSQ